MFFRKKQKENDTSDSKLKEMSANVESLLEMVIDLNERLRIVEYVLTDEGLTTQTKPEIDERGSNGLLVDAIKLVKKEQKASVSLLQKSFKISHLRAFNLLQALEEDKIIAPYRGTGERVVNK